MSTVPHTDPVPDDEEAEFARHWAPLAIPLIGGVMGLLFVGIMLATLHN